MLLAVCLVASNMRMTITGVGPILEDIAADKGVSAATLGALASLPLIVWAVVSPLAHWVGARLGMSRTVGWSLALLAAATVWRSLPGSSVNLWVGTALIGVALAVSNVLMPAIIKRDFGMRVPLVMGVYTALVGSMGAIGSGIVAPISQAEAGGAPLGWRMALVATGAMLPLVLVVWIVAMRGTDRRAQDVSAAPPPQVGRHIWRDRLAWLISSYMGTQSAVFYVLVTWLAPLGLSLGWSPVQAGFGVMFYQILGVVGSASVPLLMFGRLRRWVPALIPAVALIGIIGMLVAPAAMPLWIVITGWCGGASLSMALTLIAIRTREHRAAAALSGMSQSLGYALAAIGPLAFGGLYTISGGWTLPLIALGIVSIAQLVAGIATGGERFVFEGGTNKPSETT